MSVVRISLLTAFLAMAIACAKQASPSTPQAPVEPAPPPRVNTPEGSGSTETPSGEPVQNPEISAAQQAADAAAADAAAAEAAKAAAAAAAAAAHAAALAEKVPLPDPRPKLEKHYVGVKGFGVNRINWAKRTGSVTIVKNDDGQLVLSGSLRNGEYHIAIQGNVHPVSRREFILDGSFTGAPNVSFRNEAPTVRTSTGRFLFRATGKRRFWRMYEVNGSNCVCGEGCGNDFCYIDISFGRPKK